MLQYRSHSPPAFTFANTRRLPPHLTLANTSKSNAAFPELSRSAVLLAALLLAAAIFFFIGMAAHRIKRSPALGRLCALLLLAPFVAGAATLWRSAEPLALWMGGALLCFTLLVSLVLAWLLLKEPSASRLRAREKHQAHMVAVRGY